MSKVRVLFFAADPLAVLPNGRSSALQLGSDVREIRERLAKAGYGDALDFDWKLAARTDDVPAALRDTRPRVVHFSGHGAREGLVLTTADGYDAQQVDPEALTEIFRVFRHRVRLVVLSACYSEGQAQAIANVVGCAIGTSGEMMDADAIQFNAAFYSAIASGVSVQAAFNQASAEVKLHQPRGTLPVLATRKGVDASRIFLVPRFRRLKRAAAATALVGVSAAVIATVIDGPPVADPPLPGALRLGDCTSAGAAPLAAAHLYGPAVSAADAVSTSAAETELAEGKALCRVGNYDSAVAHFQRAHDEGIAEASAFLGIAYISGEGVAVDSQKGVDLLHHAATEEREPRAMNALAVVYENDERMAQRYRWASHWYEESAKKGFAEGMRNLGRLYRLGLGVPRSDSLALASYQSAVAAGSPEALVDIGRMHETGLAGRRNLREALRLYGEAAAAQSALGMYAMGRAYEEGVLLRRDYGQARAWYLRGACAGSPEAMNNLGALYERGLGEPADKAQAIRWFRRAADAGSTVAMANLARLDAERSPRGAKTRISPECEQPNPAGAVNFRAIVDAGALWLAVSGAVSVAWTAASGRN